MEEPLDLDHPLTTNTVNQWLRGRVDQVMEFIQLNLEGGSVPVLGWPQEAFAPLWDGNVQAFRVVQQEAPAIIGVDEAEPTAPELTRRFKDGVSRKEPAKSMKKDQLDLGLSGKGRGRVNWRYLETAVVVQVPSVLLTTLV